MFPCRPPIVMPAVVHPPKCCENHMFENIIVPHIHPTHTTNVQHQLFEHQHYFPQTQSFVQNAQYQQQMCGGRPRPPFGY
ncbi:CotD family spore coat protein [Bacillus sp. FJAT-52991]|uniref:CotD family spore coat protein n=1 Tax=Bacillus kandeliae TaxID=3129297 RepID=A0ABZ2N317_9BACI